MSGGDLVLSLFSGLGLLDMAFEQEGFCVVGGIDVLWGRDVRTFHPPGGVFAGVIGGPPCQMYSSLVHLVRANGHEPHFGDLIPEFARVCHEAQPAWFLMENVPDAPVPDVAGYIVQEQMLNNRWVGAEQPRLRRFCFGTRDGRRLDLSPDLVLFEDVESGHAVLSALNPVPVKLGGSGKIKRTVSSNSGGRGRGQASSTGTGRGENGQGHRFSLEDACELQGVPRNFTDDMPFTKEAKLKGIANGVPTTLGRPIARAIRRVMA